MAKKATPDFLLGTPSVFKVSIAGIVIDGCAESGELDGDYLLPLVKSAQRSRWWKLNLEGECGFIAISIIITGNSSGGYDLRVSLQGVGVDRPTWVSRNIQATGSTIEPTFAENSAQGGQWPAKVKVTPITSQTSTGPFAISAQSGSSSMMGLSGSGSGSGSGSIFPDPICACYVCGFWEYELIFDGIGGGDCPDCGSIEKSIPISANPYYCLWLGPFDPDDSPCGFVDSQLKIFVNEDCELIMEVRIQQFAVGPVWDKIITSCFEPNVLPLTLAPPPPDDTWCDFTGSTVTVTPVIPEELIAINLTDCIARACACKIECLPPPDLNFECDFNLICCCGRCPSIPEPKIPGTKTEKPGCT